MKRTAAPLLPLAAVLAVSGFDTGTCRARLDIDRISRQSVRCESRGAFLPYGTYHHRDFPVDDCHSTAEGVVDRQSVRA